MKTMTMLFAAAALAAIPGSQFVFAQDGKANVQVVREGSFELDTTADKALQFFTPEGERAWVKGWNPEPLYPPQAGVAFQRNSVFRVDHEGERSLWTIVEADLGRHIAEYIYVVEGERLSRVRVKTEPLGERRCRVNVRYVHTATSEKGRQFAASMTEQAFAQKMRDWQRMVSAAIQ